MDMPYSLMFPQQKDFIDKKLLPMNFSRAVIRELLQTVLNMLMPSETLFLIPISR